MPIEIGVTLDGIQYGVISGGFSIGAAVMVPLEAERLSDDELGKAVRRLFDDAKFVAAESDADWILHSGLIKGGVRPNHRYVLEQIDPNDIDRMRLFAHRSDMIQDALAEIDKAIEWVKQHDELDKSKKQRRGQTNGNKRDLLFVQIGKRDGFKCSECGSTDHLQLDHINPIANGGDGKIENLQILCRTCNIKKSDRTE